ncbi:MAG: hypothetical protein AAF670_04970 [Planctomycetota bacterium]
MRLREGMAVWPTSPTPLVWVQIKQWAFGLTVCAVIISITITIADAQESSTPLEPVLDGVTSNSRDAAVRAEQRPEATRNSFDGTPLRVIGIYGSQMGALVPDNFRPVAQTELLEALRLAEEGNRLAEPSGRLSHVVMIGRIVGDRLVGDPASAIQFESKTTADSESYHWLGHPSYAMSLSAEPSTEPQPILLANPSGGVLIQSRGRQRVPFTWSQPGQRDALETRWTLQLPPAPTISLWVGVPKTLTLSCEESAVYLAKRPPPGISVSNEDPRESDHMEAMPSGSDEDWYVVETNGQRPITLVTRANDATVPPRMTIRGCRWQYTVEGGILRWSCRLQVDRQWIGSLSPITVFDGVIDRAECDGQPIRFDRIPNPIDTVMTNPPRVSSTVKLVGYPNELPSLLRPTMMLTLSGESSIQVPGNASLPQLDFTDDALVMPEPWQVQLNLPTNQELVHWRLPHGWTASLDDDSNSPDNPTVDVNVTARESSVSTSAWIAIGPPPGATSIGSRRGTAPEWSIQVATREPLVFAEHVARFSIDSQNIAGRIRISVTMPPGRIVPIPVRFQDGFIIDEVTVGESKRGIPITPFFRRVGRLTVWPTAGEVNDGQCVIEIQGQSRRDSIERNDNVDDVVNRRARNRIRNRIPELFLARVERCQGNLTAALIPPASMSWTALTAVSSQRIDFDELTTEQRRFLAPLPGDSVLFGHSIEQTPIAWLRVPDPQLDVTIQNVLQYARNVVVHEVDVRVETALGSRSDVTIAVPVQSERPSLDFDWYFKPSEDEPLLRIATEDIQQSVVTMPGVEDEEVTETSPSGTVFVEYRLPFPESTRDRIHWVGRRDLSVKKEEWQLGLPTVREATSQRGEIWLDRQLQWDESTPYLDGLPPMADQIPRLSRWAQENGLPGDSDSTTHQFSRWRYDPSNDMTITARRRSTRTNDVIVYRQRITMLPSSSGMDETLGQFTLSPVDSFELQFPASMDLATLRTDASEVEIIRLPARGVRVNLLDRVHNQPITVHAKWLSQSIAMPIIRRIREPAIQIRGITLQHQFEYEPASDAWRIDWVMPGGRLIMGINWLLGIGLIAGWVVFGAFFQLLRRASRAILIPTIIALSTCFMWPEIWLPLAGFVVLPMVMAGLSWSTFRIRSISRSSGRSKSTATGPRRRADSNIAPVVEIDRSSIGATDGSVTVHGSPLNLEDESSDFSVTTLSMPIWFLLAGFSASTCASAQSIHSTDTRMDIAQPRTLTDVLVPVESDGSPLGDKVYVPQELYDRLFIQNQSTLVQDAMVLSAVYHLHIGRRLPRLMLQQPTIASSVADARPALADDDTQRQRLIDQWAGATQIEVELSVQTNRPTARVRLPFLREQVTEARWLPTMDPPLNDRSADREERVLPLPARGDPFVVLPVPKNTNFDLRLQLRGDIVVNGPRIEVAADVPSIAMAKLSITGEPLNASLRLRSPRIDQLTVDEYRSAAVDPEPSPFISIGPVDRFVLDFIPTSLDVSGETVPRPTRSTIPPVEISEGSVAWQRRYWLHGGNVPHEDHGKNGPADLWAEVELEPIAALDPSDTVTLELPASLGRRRFQLLCRDWEIDRSSSEVARPTSSSTWQLQLAPLSESATPIRFVAPLSMNALRGDWELPNIQLRTARHGMTRTGADEPDAVQSTWVAWTLARGDQADLSELVNPTLLPVETFYSRWFGHTGPIDQSIRIDGAENEGNVGFLAITGRTTLQSPIVTTQHHIDFSQQSCRVRFHADIIGPGETRGDRGLTLRPATGVDPSDRQLAVSDATVTEAERAEPNRQRWRIQIPSEYDVLDWRVEAIAPQKSTAITETTLVRVDGNLELLVTADPSGVSIDVDAQRRFTKSVATQPTPIVALPIFQCVSVDQSVSSQPPETSAIQPNEANRSHELLVTRSSTISVNWIQRPQAPPAPLGGERALLLADGKLLVGRWVLPAQPATLAPWSTRNQRPSVKIEPRSNAYTADARLQLRRDDGRWVVVSGIRVTSKVVPDFIDIEMPTRWCESLVIRPLRPWSRGPTLDPARQVIRVGLIREHVPQEGTGDVWESAEDPTADEPHVREIELIGQLGDSELARIGVPKLRLLGASQSRIDLVVPSRLTNEAIRWRFNAVRRVPQPRFTVSSGTQRDERSNPVRSDRPITFATMGPAWSVELEPSLRRESKPVLMLADHHWMVGQDDGGGRARITVMTRFDLMPGDAKSVEMEIPSSWRLLGVRAGGYAADIISTDSMNPDDPRGRSPSPQLVRVRLPLSRLSQDLELICELPRLDGEAIMFPTLRDLEARVTTAQWSTGTNAGKLRFLNRVPGTGDPETQPHSISLSQRAKLLAAGVVVAIASSQDAFADRRDDEVAAWLQGWLQRYWHLAISAGRTPDAIVDSFSDELNEPDGRSVPNWTSTAPKQWAQWDWTTMDHFVAQQMRRYSLDNRSISRIDPQHLHPWSSGLSIGSPVSMQPVESFICFGQPTTFPPAAVRSPIANQRVRSMWMRLLVLLSLSCLLFVVLWPGSRERWTLPAGLHRIITSPASWLLALGCLSLWLAPVSIALALILTAGVLGGFDSLWAWLRPRIRTAR